MHVSPELKLSQIACIEGDFVCETVNREQQITLSILIINPQICAVSDDYLADPWRMLPCQAPRSAL